MYRANPGALQRNSPKFDEIGKKLGYNGPVRTLIVGCGYVGTQLGRELTEAGHEVFGMRRTPNPADCEEIQWLAGDILDPDVPLPKVNWLVYAASPGGRTEALYRRCYVDGVAAALRRTQAQRSILVGSTGVMGESSGAWVDESSSPAPTTETGKVLLEAEQAFARLCPGGTVLRLSGIYGPGRTRLIRSVLDGTARKSSSLRWTNRIHRDDCAGAVHHLLKLEHADPLYLGVDEEPVDLSEVQSFIAKVVNRAPPPLEESAPRLNKRIRGDKLRESGYAFRFPTYREGYQRLIESEFTP